MQNKRDVGQQQSSWFNRAKSGLWSSPMIMHLVFPGICFVHATTSLLFTVASLDSYVWPSVYLGYSLTNLYLLYKYRPFKYWPLSMTLHAVNSGLFGVVIVDIHQRAAHRKARDEAEETARRSAAETAVQADRFALPEALLYARLPKE